MRLLTAAVIAAFTVLCSLSNALDYPQEGSGGLHVIVRGEDSSGRSIQEMAQQHSEREATRDWYKTHDFIKTEMSTFISNIRNSLVFFHTKYPALHVILRVCDDRKTSRFSFMEKYLNVGRANPHTGQFDSSWDIFRGPLQPLIEYTFPRMDTAQLAYHDITVRGTPPVARYGELMLESMKSTEYWQERLNRNNYLEESYAFGDRPSPSRYRASPFPFPIPYPKPNNPNDPDDRNDLAETSNHNDQSLLGVKASILIIGSYANGELDTDQGIIMDMGSYGLKI